MIEVPMLVNTPRCNVAKLSTMKKITKITSTVFPVTFDKENVGFFVPVNSASFASSHEDSIKRVMILPINFAKIHPITIMIKAAKILGI